MNLYWEFIRLFVNMFALQWAFYNFIQLESQSLSCILEGITVIEKRYYFSEAAESITYRKHKTE